MNFNWEDLKSDKELLLRALISQGGQRPLAEAIGRDHKSIKYWMDKYDITVQDYQHPKEECQNIVNSKEGKEERKPKYDDFGDYYIVYTSKKDIKILKSNLREFKKHYCGRDYLTLNQCARKLCISRNDLFAIKSAFNITHDDIPFIDEDVMNNQTEDLVHDELQFRKQKFEEKMRLKEYDEAIKELTRYKEQDYQLEKIMDGIVDFIPTLPHRSPLLYEVDYETPEKSTLTLNITDWHKGKFVEASSIVGKNNRGYNEFLYEEMVDKFITESISLIEMYNPEKILILNYGDGPDDPQANTYPGQEDNQDVKGEKQLLDYVLSLKQVILAVYDYQPNITYASVPGNHSKDKVNWDALANMMLFEMLKDYEKIEFDVSPIKHKVHQVYDYNLVQTHGENIRTGKYTGENDCLNMIMMEELPIKYTFIIHGHLHHERVEGSNYKRIYLPSPVGGDKLSNNMMYTTSRPASTIFLITEEGIKKEDHIYYD